MTTTSVLRFTESFEGWQEKGNPVMRELYKEVSVCANCLSEFLDDGFVYCPKCGEEILEKESLY